MLESHISVKDALGLKTYLLDLRNIKEVEVIWKHLEKEVRAVNTTSLWAWVNTWITHYQSLVDIKFLVLVKDGVPCGIAVISRETQRDLPIHVRAFHIGTNGEPYKDQVKMVNNKMLVKETYIVPFLQSIVMVLSDLGAEEIIFNEFDAGQARTIIQFMEQQKMEISISNELCRYFNLDVPRENGLGILGNLSHDTSHSVRRSLKTFENDIVVEWAENIGQALDILDELVILYKTMWKKRGKTIMFDSPSFASFQEDAVRNLFDAGRVILFRVKSRKYGTLGCLYMLIDDGVAYGYQCGFNDFESVEFKTINKKRLRTGFIVHTLCMEECLRRNIKAYNFSIGDYSYKRELTNSISQLVTISVRNGLKPIIRHKLMETYNKLNDTNMTSFLMRPLRMLM